MEFDFGFWWWQHGAVVMNYVRGAVGFALGYWMAKGIYQVKE